MKQFFFLLDITTTHNKKGRTLSETFLTLSSAYISFLFLSSHPDPPLREITELSKEKACSIRPFTDDFSTDNDQFRRCAESNDSKGVLPSSVISKKICHHNKHFKIICFFQDNVGLLRSRFFFCGGCHATLPPPPKENGALTSPKLGD